MSQSQTDQLADLLRSLEAREEGQIVAATGGHADGRRVYLVLRLAPRGAAEGPPEVLLHAERMGDLLNLLRGRLSAPVSRLEPSGWPDGRPEGSGGHTGPESGS